MTKEKKIKKEENSSDEKELPKTPELETLDREEKEEKLDLDQEEKNIPDSLVAQTSEDETEIGEEAMEEDEDSEAKKYAYYYAVGRRKSSIAQVRLYKKGGGEIKVNEKEMKEYFPREEWQSIINAPLKVMGQTNKLNAIIKVQGGGVKSQSEAIRLGIARALLKLNPIFKRGLKKYGYLTRDSRVKERKKYGLRGARRAPQWSKR